MCCVGYLNTHAVSPFAHHLHLQRCTALEEGKQMENCPTCGQPVRAIYLLPMSFAQIDEARKLAASASVSGKREKKRKTATIARLNPELLIAGRSTGDETEVSELRTGRWTNEEMLFCDKLTEKFQVGQLPVLDGVKLNDFLSRMLKSKQSRLTKKMKNAKLSAKTYHRVWGYIHDTGQARLFSELEAAFLQSISCPMERAEVRFHLQKEWRELFSTYCIHIGQKLEADDWLSSVEEMDRRDSQIKDAARMARRKKIGSTPLQDIPGEQVGKGVFVDGVSGGYMNGFDPTVPSPATGPAAKRMRPDDRLLRRLHSTPFLSKIISYIERHRIPFEHVDAWVPSFVNQQQAAHTNGQTCRLCFAGSASTGVQVPVDGRGSVSIPTEDLLDLHAFGEYSQKFSFDVGSGLPGRVYQTGIPSWERSVQHAPITHFERCGGALQCGIKTVLGIPVPSPNVGRIVLILYSRYDRVQDEQMVGRLVNEVARVSAWLFLRLNGRVWINESCVCPLESSMLLTLPFTPSYPFSCPFCL